MIEFHLGTLESGLIALGILAWGVSKAIDAYFAGKIRHLEKQIEKEGKDKLG